MTADYESDSGPDRRCPPSRARQDVTGNVKTPHGMWVAQLKAGHKSAQHEGSHVYEEIGSRSEGVRAGDYSKTLAEENGSNGVKVKKATKTSGQERTANEEEHMRSKIGTSRVLAEELTRLDIERDEEGRDQDTEFEEGDGMIAEAVSIQQSKPQQNLQQSHQQVQPGPGGGWKSFLPHGHLRVLLAEDDDCTRHVVSALLRNCKYEVTSAANGALAWQLLEKRNFQFDLVLTDVILPCMSGLELLSKMENHEACKQIPVVMMSTQDSLDIVLSCLFKGAADFLVKPVRKNELKNLWQHVWRMCNSSSVGASGTDTGKVAVPTSHGRSDNNMTGSNGDSDNGSNGDRDNGSSGLNVTGGSDNGSGNQVQVHVQPVQVQRICGSHPEAGDVDDEGQATSQAKATSGANQEMGQDLEMATPRPASRDAEQSQQPVCGANRIVESASAMEKIEAANCGEKCTELQDGEPVNSGANGSADKTSQKAIDLLGAIATHPPADIMEQPGDSGDVGEIMDQGGSKSSKNLDNLASRSYSPPTLELSLKRSRPRDEIDTDIDDRRMLRHSGSSAFSRYSTNGKGVQHQHPPGARLPPAYQMAHGDGNHGVSGGLASSESCPSHVGFLHEQAVSSKGSREVSTLLQMHLQHIQGGNGQETSSTGVGPIAQDGAHGTSQAPDETRPVPNIPNVQSNLMSHEDTPAAYRPTMNSTYYGHPHGSTTWVAAGSFPSLADHGEVFNHSHALNEHAAFGYLQHPQSQLHFHHYSEHQYKAQHQILQAPDPQPKQEKHKSVTKTGSGAQASESSTVLEGSNGESLNGGNSASGGGNGLENVGNANQGFDGASGASSLENRFAIREAALHKFRQKRKERCFEKKVRYQSRKRLAEQRPRVRGQFVRQSAHDLNVSELD
ncbi:hypothetical protein CY35_02G009400 [Sphagnum magellanicum]|nr:hypothetical protein CY35_02G009400 [Sphagnum magellanicum]